MKLTEEAIKAILTKGEKKEEELRVSFDDVEKFGDKESLRSMFLDIAKYNKMLSEKITFVNEALSAAIPFTRENLYLICAYTGSGKSTIAANISYPLWKQGKKLLVLTNEESQQDVVFRIGCLELGYSFNDYKKGMMSIDKQQEVMRLFPEISKHVKVVDVNYKNGLTTKLEGIKNAFESVKTSEYSCVLLDYYQLVQYSVNDSSRSRYDVLNDLRIWLGRYIKESNVPVVVFAQLHSIGKRNNKDLDSRIKECPAIIEPSTVIIEVVPNFEDSTSDFIIHKDRFGFAGKKIVCGFDKGRYTVMSQTYERMMAEKRLEDLDKKIKGESEAANEQT